MAFARGKLHIWNFKKWIRFTVWYKHKDDDILAPAQWALAPASRPVVAYKTPMDFQKVKETFPPDLAQVIKDSIKECLQEMFPSAKGNAPRISPGV